MTGKSLHQQHLHLFLFPGIHASWEAKFPSLSSPIPLSHKHLWGNRGLQREKEGKTRVTSGSASLRGNPKLSSVPWAWCSLSVRGAGATTLLLSWFIPGYRKKLSMCRGKKRTDLQGHRECQTSIHKNSGFISSTMCRASCWRSLGFTLRATLEAASGVPLIWLIRHEVSLCSGRPGTGRGAQQPRVCYGVIYCGRLSVHSSTCTKPSAPGWNVLSVRGGSAVRCPWAEPWSSQPPVFIHRSVFTYFFLVSVIFLSNSFHCFPGQTS